MKKIIALIICIAVIASGFSVGCSAADTQYIVNNPQGTPLYYLASENSAVLASVPYNTILLPLKSSENFVKVKYAGYSGYVDVNDLSLYGVTIGIAGIAVSQYPAKTVYYEDDEFNADGLKISAVYSDGTVKEVTGYNITVPDMNSAGTKTVYISYSGKRTSFDIDILRLPLSEIKITKEPESYDVIEGTEKPLFDGMELTAYFTDGRPPVTADKYSITNYNPEILGEQNVTLYYKYPDISTNITINVIPKSVTKLEIERLPDKTEYYDDDLNPVFTGMIVRAFYNNGKSEIITPERVEFANNAVSGAENDMTVFYKGCSVNYTVTVNRTVLSGLRVISPAKTNYILNEETDFSGIGVFAVYNSGNEIPVQDYDIDTPDTSSCGKKTVNVYYDNFSASFDITVVSDASIGDIDKNGKVNSSDARLALRISLKLENATDEQIFLGDINKDGKLTTIDARKILRCALKLESIE